MKNILIVDDEAPFLLSLTDGLNSYTDNLTIYQALNGAEAVKVIESVKLDLVITDLNMPVMSGFELLAYIASKHLAIPIIVMTAYGTPEIEEKLNRMGSFQYVEKPLEFNTLFEMIENTLNEGTQGYMQGITLPSFLQLLALEKKTCTLTVKSSANKTGRMFFSHGDLLNAETGSMSGLEAAYKIISWGDVELKMSGKCEKKTRKINIPLIKLLMESSQSQDEDNHDEKRRDQHALNEDEEYLDVMFKEPKLHGTKQKTNALSHHKEELSMGVQDQLKEFSTLDGFAGVGLFTPAGESLAMLTADAKINFNEIGVLANNVLMNAQKASLDMGTGKGEQVHIQAEHAQILVRCLNEGTDPLKSQPGKAHIHLVLVLKEEGSIGMAKMKLNKGIELMAPDFRM
ncbi:MAG: response regulator [Deltaproteobacteria bacterium]|nr:response regulator [Deltaproteobacteria bacterium]